MGSESIWLLSTSERTLKDSNQQAEAARKRKTSIEWAGFVVSAYLVHIVDKSAVKKRSLDTGR